MAWVSHRFLSTDTEGPVASRSRSIFPTWLTAPSHFVHEPKYTFTCSPFSCFFWVKNFVTVMRKVTKAVKTLWELNGPPFPCKPQSSLRSYPHCSPHRHFFIDAVEGSPDQAWFYSLQIPSGWGKCIQQMKMCPLCCVL